MRTHLPIATVLALALSFWMAAESFAQGCTPPPPQCTIDPITRKVTCTKVCQATPQPTRQATSQPPNTPPARGTPPPTGQPPRFTPPAGSSSTPAGTTAPGTPRPNLTPGAGTPGAGTPSPNLTPGAGTPVPGSSPTATPTPITWRYITQCYANGTGGPPGMDSSYWSSLELAAEGAGFGGVQVGIYYVYDPSGNITATWYVVEGYCLPAPVPSPTPIVYTPPPCKAQITFDASGATLQCDAYHNEISVSSGPPCNQVNRNPAPRGLVSLENTLSVQPGVGTNAQGIGPESWSPTCWTLDPLPDAKDYRPGRTEVNYQIGLRWRLLRGMPPQWDFDERPWNVGRSGNKEGGWTVRHTYETSSFDRPANGPSLAGVFDLPSYQVKVETYWVAEWAETWLHWHEDCVNEIIDASGNLVCTKYDYSWHQHFNGWYPLDLRRYGNATAYFASKGVSSPDARILPPKVCVQALPVPVIESQSVIGK